MMNKIALVTGGTGGIGTAICRRLASEGYAVVTTYLCKQSFADWRAKNADFEARGFYCDVSDWDSCVSYKRMVGEQVGAPSVVVNNAGITRDSVFMKMSAAQWREVMSTNLDSVFYVCKQFVPEMVAAGFGRVINISSVNGQKGQFGQTNYSAAKAGLHGFTKALAQEVVRKGVTVNTVSPGYIGTDMVLSMKEEVQDKVRAMIPVGRFGEPDEIARLVAFLAAAEAGFITGANFSANGGQHMY